MVLWKNKAFLFCQKLQEKNNEERQMEKKNIRIKIKENVQYYMGEIHQTGYHFMKWAILSIVTGSSIGVFSSVF